MPYATEENIHKSWEIVSLDTKLYLAVSWKRKTISRNRIDFERYSQSLRVRAVIRETVLVCSLKAHLNRRKQIIGAENLMKQSL